MVFAVMAVQAQTVTCHIDGPANVRQQPNTKSAVMGSIKNGMVATVSQVNGNMWKIHEVHNPRGGSAYTGRVVGYYTHRQNLIFDMGGNDGGAYSPRSSTTSNNKQSSGRSWMYGTWRYGRCQFKITANNLTIISEGQNVYSGPYEYKSGEGTNWNLITFIPKNATSLLITYRRVPSMILANSAQKRLYFDIGEPMIKVK